MMSPAGGRHGRVALRIARRLGNYVEEHRLGETFAAETGFLLRTQPDTVRAPDVAFVSTEKLRHLADFPGYLPLAPDLVVEVTSPGDRSSAVEEKCRDWLSAGVTVVLVVDPQTRTMHEYRSAQQIRAYADGWLDLGDLLPGFRLDVADIFST